MREDGGALARRVARFLSHQRGKRGKERRVKEEESKGREERKLLVASCGVRYAVEGKGSRG